MPFLSNQEVRILPPMLTNANINADTTAITKSTHGLVPSGTWLTTPNVVQKVPIPHVMSKPFINNLPDDEIFSKVITPNGVNIN